MCKESKTVTAKILEHWSEVGIEIITNIEQKWLKCKQEEADKTKKTVTPCKGCHCNDPKIERVKCTKKVNIKRLEKIIVDSKCRLKIYWEDLRHLQRDNKIERKTKAVEGTTSKKEGAEGAEERTIQKKRDTRDDKLGKLALENSLY
ncbi:37027_t:CDS:2 [Gigaspora margarita]|uniref:37027_t:CDS:1 n=1 Tax=Gigaspora margarita TaxID=4874 RepID=A0ABN7VX80_GIGMA|nr:37027_t:CDS:2 [Gigaspora margarita]